MPQHSFFPLCLLLLWHFHFSSFTCTNSADPFILLHSYPLSFTNITLVPILLPLCHLPIQPLLIQTALFTCHEYNLTSQNSLPSLFQFSYSIQILLLILYSTLLFYSQSIHFLLFYVTISPALPSSPSSATFFLLSLLLLPSCHDLESNPQLSPAFIGLLNNLTDYNAKKSINSTGQVTILRK